MHGTFAELRRTDPVHWQEMPGEPGYYDFSYSGLKTAVLTRVRAVTRTAFGQQHPDEVLGTAVAEQLPLVLLVPGNAVPVDQGQEIQRGYHLGRGGAEARGQKKGACQGLDDHRTQEQCP